MIAIAFLLFAALVLAWLAAPSREASVMRREPNVLIAEATA
jgi:hypothetical protein